MRRTPVRGLTSALVACLCATVLTQATPAIAQDENNENEIDLTPVPDEHVTDAFKVDDGSYIGVVSNSLSLRKDGAIVLVLVRDGSGPTSFTVTNEVLDGTWSMTEIGGLWVENHPGLAEADSVTSSVGTLSGSFPYVLEGSLSTDADGTVTAGPLGMTATSSGSGTIEVSYGFNQVVQVCGQVQANWDQAVIAQYVGLGFIPSIKTQLVAFPETPLDEIQDRLAALTESVVTATQAAADPMPTLIFMVDALHDAEQLMSDIDSHPTTCPLGDAFLRVINQALRDLMNSLLEHWDTQTEGVEMIMMRRLVEVGLRAGVLGAGSADPVAAEYLRTRILDRVQSQYDSGIEGDFDTDEIRRTVVVANMLGHELSPNLSNADLCVGLGGC